MRRRESIQVTALLLFVVSAFANELRSVQRLNVPSGFEIRGAIRTNAVKFPMFAAFDQKSRLFVTESSGLDLYEELQKLTRRCRITLLEDRDADGIFEHSQVFADKLVFPMGVAWRENKLYVADPPDLITLEDTDNDGRADKRSVLLTGFGHTDNGSLHGLTFGPDGWLYMTMGQPDGFHVVRADGKVVEGKSGALLRCKPDGSEFEVLSRGFENLVEVVFLPTGEIIGTDNWFFLPQDGVRDALVHLLPGATYPLNAHAKAESTNFFSGELLPPVKVYPAVAHSGLMRHSGKNMPTKMQGNLFSAQFNTRKIIRHELTRTGSTFDSIDEDFLTTDDPDFHPSDVLEAADGSIIVIDTGSWYVHHCPTGRIRKSPAEGGIYRIRHTNEVQLATPATSGDDNLALRARELGRTGDQKHSSELARLLAHKSAHVRLAAAEGLAACGTSEAVPSIIHALAQKNDPHLRHDLIYALHKLADSKTLETLLTYRDPHVRRAALIVLDQAPHRKLPMKAALEAIRSEDQELRAAALAALQRHPEWKSEAVSVVLKLIADRSLDSDPVALADLVTFFADAEPVRSELAKATEDEARTVTARAASLQLLGQVTRAGNVHPAVRTGLKSKEPELARAAMQSLTTKQIPATHELLNDVATSPGEPGVRLEAIRILARHQPKLSPSHFDILSTALRPSNPPAPRLAAVEILSNAELTGLQLAQFVLHARDDTLISPNQVIAAAQKCKDLNPARIVLLDYLRQCAIGDRWQIPPASVEWLQANLGIARTVDEFANASREHLSAAARLRMYEPLLEGGDPNNGQQIFLGKGACSTCHRVGKHGGVIGPDLTKIGAVRSGRDLIESLALPSTTLAQGYESYRVKLKDGETLTGMRVRTADHSFMLRDSSGAERRLNENEIETTERLETSAMPDGLLGALSEAEIRDLLAYLQSLR